MSHRQRINQAEAAIEDGGRARIMDGSREVATLRYDSCAALPLMVERDATPHAKFFITTARHGRTGMVEIVADGGKQIALWDVLFLGWSVEFYPRFNRTCALRVVEVLT